MPKIKTSKAEILEKASPVFQEYGYYNTSISKLSKACGIEKAHFYYYFKNKEDLMLEVLQYIFDKAEETLIQPAWDEDLEKGERLQIFLTAFEAFFVEDEEGQIFANTILQTLNNSSPFESIAQTLYTQLVKTVAHLYEERYSANYAINKAEQAIQDLQGGLVLSQVYKDKKYIKGALKRVGKKV